jgi:DNA-binding transcriptional regulator YdaS (Cro superfamily)
MGMHDYAPMRTLSQEIVACMASLAYTKGMTLEKYLLLTQTSRYRFAKDLGVLPATVSKWCLGQRCPRPPLIRAISAATEGAVSAADWIDEHPSRAKRSEGAAA